jgi:phosphoribosylformylglycinamidine (FGAM) synthase PurS component
MHVDKAKKRIAKQVKKGDKGFPKISLEYFGETTESASSVLVQFTLEEGAEVQEQRFASESDAREDETIQTAIVKIIERADANTVIEAPEINVSN